MKLEDAKVGDKITIVFKDNTLLSGRVTEDFCITELRIPLSGIEHTVEVVKENSLRYKDSFHYTGDLESYANLVYWAREHGYIDMEMSDTKNKTVSIRRKSGELITIKAGETIYVTPSVIYTR